MRPVWSVGTAERRYSRLRDCFPKGICSVFASGQRAFFANFGGAGKRNLPSTPRFLLTKPQVKVLRHYCVLGMLFLPILSLSNLAAIVVLPYR